MIEDSKKYDEDDINKIIYNSDFPKFKRNSDNNLILLLIKNILSKVKKISFSIMKVVLPVSVPLAIITPSLCHSLNCSPIFSAM